MSDLRAMVKPLETPASHQMKADAGLPNLPTQLTYECRLALTGEGPRAYDWSDKPHRIVYDLCREIERLALDHAAFERAVAEAVERERGLAIHVAASLNAAISLLERGGKKAAPSDKMFRQMLLDYHKALDDWRAAIRKGDTP